MTTISDDIQAIGRIDAVPSILEVICRVTGMRFAAVARVTEDRWTACAVRDEIAFGLVPGGELELTSTICNEIRQSGTVVVIDHVAEDAAFRDHHTPRLYGFQSYISMPIVRTNGEFFGTLCAIDPLPAKLNNPATIATFKVFAELIALQLESQRRLANSEAALRQSQKMEAVGQLTGGIAHDFNNMLTGIMGAIDIVRRRIATGRVGDLERFLTAAAASAQRAAALTQRLLMFSRRQPLDPHPVDVNALVVSLDILLRQTVTERIALEFSLGADMPPAIVDANQLESAILNLAINARDAMGGGGTLTIATGTEDLTGGQPGVKAGRYVTVTVRDTGTGMSPEVLEKAVEPFFTTKPMGQGTGLGLSMVHGFVTQSDGQMRIDSAPSQGTGVAMYLPAADPAEQPQAAEARAEPAPGRGRTVLLVEDDDSVRLLVREALEELGYSVLEAARAQAAVPILASNAAGIDLMIADQGLPDMSGNTLADLARERWPGLPILFISGHDGSVPPAMPNTELLAKPFTLDALTLKIGQMLAR